MRKKKTILFGILVFIMSLGLGYAFLTTNLNIEGIADIDSNTWNVYWDNVEVRNGSVSGAQVIQAPTIDSSKTKVTYHIHLKEPGDYYEFTVDTVNDGTIDAMINKISYTLNGVDNAPLPKFISTVTNYEDIPAEEKQILRAHTRKTYRFVIKYRDDISPGTLPTTPQSFSASISFEYVQADSTAIPVDTIYEVSTENFQIGGNIPSGATTYTDVQSAINDFGQAFANKHVVLNDQILLNYVGFRLNGRVYYLRSHSGSATYQRNKDVMTEAFGPENCYGDSAHYYCYNAATGLSAIACPEGCANAHNSQYVCEVDDNGKSFCTSCALSVCYTP